jgi:hypothetical protein
MLDDPYLASGVFLSVVTGCSALGGWIAYNKRRSPIEGVLLGLFLGPIGVFIESRHPYSSRPMVDENAWNSLHSMVTYQQTSRESLARSKKKKTGWWSPK